MKSYFKAPKVSGAVIKRLPMYYRFLFSLYNNHVERISSRELSHMMGITSSQLRQDLSHFGEFGQQGYGYRVDELLKIISDILGITNHYTGVIIGAGNIGRAILTYPGFIQRGFMVMGIFDNDPKKIGQTARDLYIKPMDELPQFLQEEHIDIGIIVTPAKSAQIAADVLVENGVKGIWNFAPTDLKIADNVIVENMYLGDSLLELFYKIKERSESE
ncbi:redox-sensing transcriptional repressor [Desulfonispora thiosulfatigenes DSM 11270]|uniref:Redox-sensing transcriptional repressor Rex n=1 Tax=Desulfonispora thiosulfatigenes DSM 11270 TaxID=656914 RepID=A0A1W1V7W2_DESTI|nr:redox-sensing transcriptional repressor Rex [Desulfonispora thiosulfatigenes]SMB89353.1 redox-sensing transcriptional repressor [Desulfonispora thiosulfatigenes DSM 11270]